MRVDEVETPEVETPGVEVDAPLAVSDDTEEPEGPTSEEMLGSSPDLDELPEFELDILTETEYQFPEGYDPEAQSYSVTGTGGLPVNGTISQEWGRRSSGYASGRHEGVDFAVPVGTQVTSPLGGTVLWAKWAGAYGWAVLVAQEDGTYSLVAHLSRMNVKSGQRVQAGQLLGLSGNSGNSTGPHVHWEIRTGPQYGSSIDPMGWVGNRGGSSGGGGQPQQTSSLVGLAQRAGFTAQQARVMAAIAMAESGGRPGAFNGNASTGDESYGLWQINMLGDMGPQRRQAFGISSNQQLFDPMTNALAAKRVFDWQGFNAWSVYKSGRYLDYL